MVDSMNLHVQRPQHLPQMNPGYENWIRPLEFQKPNPSFGAWKPPQARLKKSMGPRVNRDGKRYNGKGRTQVHKSLNRKSVDYNPMLVNDLQHRGVLKPRNFLPPSINPHRKSFGNDSVVPFAPRNTTSFLIRSKGRRGNVPSVTPSPQTPAVFPTPKFSPLPDALVNKAEEAWGIDGYGSMNGLIRLRTQGHEPLVEVQVDDEDVGEMESSESDVEQHVEMEKRVDQDLSRFEMVLNPTSMIRKMDDQDTQLAHLQEENSILKEKVVMIEREMEELRAKMDLFGTKENGREQ